MLHQKVNFRLYLRDIVQYATYSQRNIFHTYRFIGTHLNIFLINI